MERTATKQLGPDGTVIVRPRRRDFDAATILVSGVASLLFCAFATIASLV